MSTELSIFNHENMGSLMKFADLMAQGVSTVPKHLQGKPADCMAIAMQALQWGMNPYAVAQKTHIVNGALGYESQLVNAVIQKCGAIVGNFHYQYGGGWKSDTDPTAWVKVGAVLVGESDITWGQPVYPALQSVKNSPLWKTDPRQQCAYLAVKKWARLYCPGAILGVYTREELEEIEVKGERLRPVRKSAVADILENTVAPQTESAPAETEAPAEIDAPWWSAMPNDQIIIEITNRLELVETLGELKTAFDWVAVGRLSAEDKNSLRALYVAKQKELAEKSANETGEAA